MLKIDELQVSYGGIRGPAGHHLRGAGRQDRHPDRRQRRGQVHHPAHHRRAGQARPAARIHLQREEHAPACPPTRIVSKRASPGPRGTAGVRRPDGAGEPEDRRLSAQDKSGMRGRELGVRLFPRLKERSWQCAGHALRRRAADARRGPRAHEPPEAADDGRAVPRSCAPGGAGNLRDHPAPSISRA